MVVQLRAGGPMNGGGQLSLSTGEGIAITPTFSTAPGYGASHRVLSSTRGGLRLRPWLFGTRKHHPGNEYRIAAIIGVGVNDAYPTITVTALDIATYIQKRDPSIPWNVCFTAGAYMETWVDYSRQGFDGLAASEILSQGVSNGLKGKVE